MAPYDWRQELDDSDSGPMLVSVAALVITSVAAALIGAWITFSVVYGWLA